MKRSVNRHGQRHVGERIWRVIHKHFTLFRRPWTESGRSKNAPACRLVSSMRRIVAEFRPERLRRPACAPRKRSSCARIGFPGLATSHPTVPTCRPDHTAGRRRREAAVRTAGKRSTRGAVRGVPSPQWLSVRGCRADSVTSDATACRKLLPHDDAAPPEGAGPRVPNGPAGRFRRRISRPSRRCRWSRTGRRRSWRPR